MMNENSALNNFPKTRIKPYDGMSITADVWAEAHAEHRNAMRAHDLFFHGTGIVAGLQVLANDPPDQYVFISPGVAIDTEGNIIVLNEPVAYDFGEDMEGELYLLLAHGEREVGGTQNDIKYVQNEFMIAARPKLPKKPTVELARIRLSRRGTAIKNAANAMHPEADEVDMRYRVEIGPAEKRMSRIGLCYLGNEVPAGVLAGWDYLNREYKRATSNYFVTEDNVSLTSDLQNFALLYLCGSGTFTIQDEVIKRLKNYLEQGGSLFVEDFNEAAEESFKPVISGLGLTVKPVAEYDSLLKNPYLFNVPPEGNQGNRVLLGKKIIYSHARYTLAWGGKVSGGAGSRSDIRSATEWGVNMLQYCLQ